MDFGKGANRPARQGPYLVRENNGFIGKNRRINKQGAAPAGRGSPCVNSGSRVLTSETPPV